MFHNNGFVSLAIFKISVYFYVVMFAIQIVLDIKSVVAYSISIKVNLNLIFLIS